MTNWGITSPPGSRPPRPSTRRNRSIMAELSTRRAWPWGGLGCGARIRDRPAAATIWRPLTEPSRQPRVASTQAITAVISRAKPGSEQDQQRKPDHQAEQHAGGGDDRSGEGLPGGRVAEQEDRPLEAPVDQSPGHAAEDVADGRTEQQADHRRVRAAVRPCGRSRIRPPIRPARRGGGSPRRRSCRLPADSMLWIGDFIGDSLWFRRGTRRRTANCRNCGVNL